MNAVVINLDEIEKVFEKTNERFGYYMDPYLLTQGFIEELEKLRANGKEEG